MTTAEVKKLLHEYLPIKRELDQIAQQLKQFETLMGSPTGGRMDGMPHGSGKSDPVQQAVERHEDLIELYRRKMDALLLAQIRIETLIDCLDPISRKLLRHRYIEGLKWEEVCVRMHYCWGQVHTYHREALKRLTEEVEWSDQ